METITAPPIHIIRIDNTDIFLQEFDEKSGKITISDTGGHNYSHYWGSMGDGLKLFLCRINASYFADKLMGAKSEWEIDVKMTFQTLRKFISKELDLPWYKHMKFQKHMREIIKEFQDECEGNDSQEYFVNSFFPSFINRLSFFEIDDRYDREQLEKEFKGISECWNFIGQKHTREYLWLVELHRKLKIKLQSA